MPAAPSTRRHLALLLLSGLTLAPASTQQPTNATTPNKDFVTLTDVTIGLSNKLLPIGLNDGVMKSVTFDYNITYKNVTRYRKKGWKILVNINEANVASVQKSSVVYIPENQPNGNFTIEMKGESTGRSVVNFKVGDWFERPYHSELDAQGEILESAVIADVDFDLYVMRTKTWADKVFDIVILCLVLTTNIGMGIKVEMAIVKDALKKPIGASIGMFSQLVMMPLIAYGVVRILDPSPGLGLGLFVCGCAPGGLASNIFAYLLGGNISLSITMTLLSTLASVVMIPFWLYTLGATLYHTSSIKIPFFNIMASLMVLLVPTLIGLFMQFKCVRAANWYTRALRYILWCFIVILFTFGVYCNWWITKVTDTKILVASAALPYVGFLFGGLVAVLAGLSRADIVTIAIETGIQNTAVPLVLLSMSLQESVEKQVSIVVPLLSSTLTPIPLLLILVYREVKKLIASRQYKKRMSESAEEMTEPPPPVSMIETTVTRIKASISSKSSDREDRTKDREDRTKDREVKEPQTTKRALSTLI